MKFLLEYNKYKLYIPSFLGNKKEFFEKAKRFLLEMQENYPDLYIQQTVNNHKNQYILFILNKMGDGEYGSGFRFRFDRNEIYFNSYSLKGENIFRILEEFIESEFDCRIYLGEFVLNSIPDKFPNFEDFIFWKDSKKFDL